MNRVYVPNKMSEKNTFALRRRANHRPHDPLRSAAVWFPGPLFLDAKNSVGEGRNVTAEYHNVM